jgi:hypothetical protein
LAKSLTVSTHPNKSQISLIRNGMKPCNPTMIMHLHIVCLLLNLHFHHPLLICNPLNFPV